MTRKQAKMFAKIHSAALIGSADAFMFMDNMGNQDGIPDADQQKMVDACIELAIKIQGDLPEMGHSFDIYKYVIKTF